MDKLGRCLRSSWESWAGASSPSTRPSTLFQYMSDLHLEVGQQYLTFDFDRTAPNLILAGDIGRLIDYEGYLAFLQKQTARYEHVFLVLGNHEFYGTSFEAGVAYARQLEKELSLDGKLVLLHRNTFILEEPKSSNVVAVLGCPLWSHITEASAPAVRAVVSDFKKIEHWTIDTHNAAHTEDLHWLRQEVATLQRDKPHASILVVTHHAPLLDRTASPQHNDSPVKQAFATDVLLSGDGARERMWSQVTHWVFGHTHWTTQFKVKKGMGIQVVANQRGYVFPGNNVRLGVEKQPPKHTFDAARTI